MTRAVTSTRHRLLRRSWVLTLAKTWAAAANNTSPMEVKALAMSLLKLNVLAVERSYEPKLVMGLELRGTTPYIESQMLWHPRIRSYSPTFSLEESNAAKKYSILWTSTVNRQLVRAF